VREGAAKLIATFFYVGLIPVAPGTFGTLAAVPLFWLISGLPIYIYLLITLVVIGVSIWAATVTEQIYGRRDPGEIVADEVAGYLVTMVLIPPTALNIVVGFFLFRLFDIVKPPPVRSFEKLPRGWGVVVDDVAAGVYACVCMHLILRFL
jgi:phosphatidylglycerophosphatase A